MSLVLHSVPAHRLTDLLSCVRQLLLSVVARSIVVLFRLLD